MNEKGQCCGKKPILYKGKYPVGSGKYPQLWCSRCGRAYDPETKEQIENWEWKLVDGKWTDTAAIAKAHK